MKSLSLWGGRSAILLLSVTLLSCSNWLVRQECKQVNWYQHAYDVAMEGRRLSGDDRIERCRKAEYDMPDGQLDLGFKAGMSNYCKPEIVYATGKKGDYFNTDLCDPGQANFLKQRHKEGVYVYCAVDNGFGAGASGKKYQNICPAGMEKGFLKEYNRGRKKYLTALIDESEREILTLDRQILDDQRESASISHRLNLLNLTRPAAANPADDPAAPERDRMNSDIRRLNYQIDQKRAKQGNLRQKIKDSKVEMAGLD